MSGPGATAVRGRAAVGGQEKESQGHTGDLGVGLEQVATLSVSLSVRGEVGQSPASFNPLWQRGQVSQMPAFLTPSLLAGRRLENLRSGPYSLS